MHDPMPMKTNDQELESCQCAAIGLPKITTTPVHCGLVDSKDPKTIRANLFQSIPMDVTVSAAARLSNPAFASPHIEAWLAGCHVDAPVSSNIGANDLPFQRWMKFKEAFSPTFVINALASLPEVPTSCVDPFGGSGTTALACSFLGIEITTIEVNPFLADLIEAKITLIRASSLATAYAQVLDVSRETKVNAKKVLASAPKSLREPGVNGRFVFWAEAIDRILAIRAAIESVESPKNRRLLTVLLGSILVEASNVVVNGKGRRYRGSGHRTETRGGGTPALPGCRSPRI